MTTKIFYSDEFNKHDNLGHPENSKRLKVMLQEIKDSDFYNELDFVEPKILDEKILKKIHSDRMIQQIKDISSYGDSWIDLDTYVCKSDFEIARLAAGAVLQACDAVIEKKADNAFALVRPPGHHATKNRSMGFCLFNNAAIAANELAKNKKKILIFDCDVHHGNGTQEIFYDRNDVMYQSFHLFPHYPGTGDIDEIGEDKGKGFTINAPLSYGLGDKAVDSVLENIFLPISEQFNPDIIIISTGYDSHHLDPLGGLKLTSNFYGTLIKKLQKIQSKIVCTLEGGYNLNWIGKCINSQLAEMSENKLKISDKADEYGDVKKIILNIKKKIKEFWEL